MLLSEGNGVNQHCLDELGAYLAFVLTFSRALSIFLEYAVPALSRFLAVWIEENRLREALKRVLERAPSTDELKKTAPWAADFVRRVSRRSTADPDAADTMPLPPMSRYEEEAKLEPHDGVFFEYNSLIINLGYVRRSRHARTVDPMQLEWCPPPNSTLDPLPISCRLTASTVRKTRVTWQVVLFAPAFPIASAICWVTFVLEIKADAFKLLRNTRRPRYLGAEDIGSWQKVLWFLSTISVLTNTALIGAVSSQFQSWLPFNFFGIEINQGNKVTFLFVCEHLILAGQYLVASALPDLPEDVAVERALARWRAEVAGDALAGRTPTPKEEWDDKKIPRKFFGALGGGPLATETKGALNRSSSNGPASSMPPPSRLPPPSNRSLSA